MPLRERLGVDAPLHKLKHLRATVQQQAGLLLAFGRRAVLDKDEGVVAVFGMTHVKGHLMGSNLNLPASGHNLQLDGDESPVPEREQRIRDAQTNPGLNPGNKAV